MFIVSTPATSTALLTQSELRAAAGVSDGGADAALALINGRVSALIASACRVPRSGQHEPTILSEGITETFRIRKAVRCLIPARRFAYEITSITEDGTPLDPEDFELELDTGLIFRLSSDDRICWTADKIVVVYKAGFTTVPSEIKAAASKLVADFYASGTRDPNLKREKIEGVSEREYFIFGAGESPVHKEVSELIAPFVNLRIG